MCVHVCVGSAGNVSLGLLNLRLNTNGNHEAYPFVTGYFTGVFGISFIHAVQTFGKSFLT